MDTGDKKQRKTQRRGTGLLKDLELEVGGRELGRIIILTKFLSCY